MFTGVFRLKSNIYKGAILRKWKTAKSRKPLIIFAKAAQSKMFDWALNTPLMLAEETS